MGYLPFNELIEHLRRQGFVIGIDHHLQLQSLLNKLGPDCAPEELKTLLCPVFATSKKQQQQFYQAFDSHYEIFKKDKQEKESKTESVATEEEAKEHVLPIRARKWPYFLTGTILVLLLSIFGYWYAEKYLIIVEEPGDKLSLAIPDSVSTPSDTTGLVTTADTLIVPIPSPNQPPSTDQESALDSVNAWTKRIARLNQFVPEVKLTIYQEYWQVIRWLALIVPFLVFVLVEIYKFNRRKLILQKQHGKKPPFVWPIQVLTPELKLLKNEQFYSALRSMRQRLESDVVRLDIKQSVSSTIDAAGFPTFEYAPFTRPPEYLVLIDLPTFSHHHAHWYENLVKDLENNGLFVERYFYDHDPRVCFQQIGDEHVLLSDLLTRYSDNRVLIFGSCDNFLNPISGQLDDWTSVFDLVKERAILTPVRPKLWGRREVALAHKFVILPGTLNGLNTLVEHLTGLAGSDFKGWQLNDSDKPQLFTDALTNIDALRSYLGENCFQWLCACAVYPEVHWDLTLYLGAQPFMPDSLITEENLLRLIRLPWFHKGSIPDEVRWQLIAELDADVSIGIRRAIINLLEKTPAPPKESYAYGAYHLNLVVQRWLLSRKSRKERKELLEAMRNLPQQSLMQDYTLMRFLESEPKSMLHLPLPAPLRKLFYNKGIPAFGFKNGVRIFSAALAMVVVYLILGNPYLPVYHVFQPEKPVLGAIFDDKRKHIITYSKKGNINIWDQNDGSLHWGQGAGRGEEYPVVLGVKLSHNGDLFLTFYSDGVIRISDFNNGSNASTLFSHTAAVTSARFSSNDLLVLSASQDSSVRLLDAASGKEESIFYFSRFALSTAFSSDGRTLASGTDSTIQLWDMQKREKIARLEGHTDSVWIVAFSLDGRTVGSGSFDMTVRLWDVASGLELHQLTGHTDWVMSVAFSPDGRTVASGSWDSTLRLWDMTNGKELAKLTGHNNVIYCVAFSPDGRTLASGSLDKTVRLWDVAMGRELAMLIGHNGAVNSVAFSPDGRTVASGSEDMTVRLWDVASGQEVHQLTGHSGEVRSVAFNPDGRTVVSGSSDKTVRLWDVATRLRNAATGQQVNLSLKHEAGVLGAMFSADEKRILSWSNDGTARLWDAATGQPMGQNLKHEGEVSGAVFSSDDQQILAWSSDSTARLWDVSTGGQIGLNLQHEGAVNGAVFSSDQQRILTWSSDSTARVWNTANGTQIDPNLKHEGAVNGAIYSSDGQRILTWSSDSTARVWDAGTGTQIGRNLEHESGVNSAAFSSDEQRILTWSSEGAHLWDGATGQQIGPTLKHEADILGAMFSADEKRILTWGNDGVARLLDIDPFLLDSTYFGPEFTKFPQLVSLPGGRSYIGSDKGLPSERPIHRVSLQPFAISKYEITNAQFVEFLADSGNQQEAGGGLWLLIDPQYSKIRETSPANFVAVNSFENYPVLGVSWYGAMAYCRWLTQKTGIPFRLPTEAEWEYACKGPQDVFSFEDKQYSFGSDSTGFDAYGWFYPNSGFNGPREVGQKQPNGFGLYDMHGNMWEWCLDAWRQNHENASAEGLAPRPVSNELRVARGGSWYDPVSLARTTRRYNFVPVLDINQVIGFRVVASLHDGYLPLFFEIDLRTPKIIPLNWPQLMAIDRLTEVTIRATVDEDGRLYFSRKNEDIIDRGHPVAAEEIEKALLTWRYKPFKVGTILFYFNLASRGKQLIIDTNRLSKRDQILTKIEVKDGSLYYIPEINSSRVGYGTVLFKARK